MVTPFEVQRVVAAETELRESGAPCPTRTDHLLITNQLLYQMS